MNSPLLSAGSQSVLLLALQFSFGRKPCSYFMRTNIFFSNAERYTTLKGGKSYIFFHILFKYVLLKDHLLTKCLESLTLRALLSNGPSRSFGVKFCTYRDSEIKENAFNSDLQHAPICHLWQVTPLFCALISSSAK